MPVASHPDAFSFLPSFFLSQRLWLVGSSPMTGWQKKKNNSGLDVPASSGDDYAVLGALWSGTVLLGLGGTAKLEIYSSSQTGATRWSQVDRKEVGRWRKGYVSGLLWMDPARAWKYSCPKWIIAQGFPGRRSSEFGGIWQSASCLLSLVTARQYRQGTK